MTRGLVVAKWLDTMQREPSDLGCRVAKLRRAAKLSARELSLAIGASHGVVAQLECGTITDLRSSFIPRLAKALGTTSDYLLTGEGSEPTPEQTREAFEAWKGQASSAEAAA